MAYFDWEDNMSVKVAEIDKQHQALIKLMNGLFSAMKEGRGNTIFERLTSDLLKYTEVHFGAEEKYFDLYGYPDAAMHKIEHKKFIQKIQAVQNDFQNGKMGLSLAVMDFLKDWLINHIMGTDKQYTQFFNEKGLR